MSMDAGGLAQMTYNNFSPVGGVLGAPGTGFASRGKASQLKRLNLASPPKVGSISENPADVPVARTSRSHLLAGLRTAPRSNIAPVSAPYVQSRFGFDDVAQPNSASFPSGPNYPQTATSSSFVGPSSNSYGQQNPASAQNVMFAGPEQVLAPPPVQYPVHDEKTDPNMVAQLMATEVFLAQRQQQLQQQLAQLTAQQFSNMQLSESANQSSFSPAATPHSAYFGATIPTSVPQAQEVLGRPGLANMYRNVVGGNGQYHSVSEPITQQLALATSPPPMTPGFVANTNNSPPKSSGQGFRFQPSPPREASPPTSTSSNGSSLHRKTPSPPQDVTPLPPPSANAFRRGHKKASSLAFSSLSSNSLLDGPKTSVVRGSDFPRTPMTGTFGPGQARIGEHPSRQPRGPPPMEDLLAKPTSKHAGSKNFATRARRSAWHKIRRAGIERSTGRPGSAGSMTPASDGDMTLPSYLDGDADVLQAGSTALPSTQSSGNLRQIPRSVIGSERKEMQERFKVRRAQTSSGAFDDGISPPPSGVTATFGSSALDDEVPLGRKTPLLVLTSAEKRRSAFL